MTKYDVISNVIPTDQKKLQSHRRFGSIVYMSFLHEFHIYIMYIDLHTTQMFTILSAEMACNCCGILTRCRPQQAHLCTNADKSILYFSFGLFYIRVLIDTNFAFSCFIEMRFINAYEYVDAQSNHCFQNMREFNRAIQYLN